MRNQMRRAVVRIVAVQVQGSRVVMNDQMQAATVGQAAPIMTRRCRITKAGMIRRIGEQDIDFVRRQLNGFTGCRMQNSIFDCRIAQNHSIAQWW